MLGNHLQYIDAEGKVFGDDLDVLVVSRVRPKFRDTTSLITDFEFPRLHAGNCKQYQTYRDRNTTYSLGRQTAERLPEAIARGFMPPGAQRIHVIKRGVGEQDWQQHLIGNNHH